MAALEQRVPELVAEIDVRTLPLSALDGFVLSRIDGRANVGEIVAMTGLGLEQVQAILGRLEALGAVRWRGERASSRAPRMPTPPPHGASIPPGGSSVPPRRRPSHTYSHGPRKLFAESPISGAPPDLRSISQRPRTATPVRGRTPVPFAGPGTGQLRSPASARPSERPRKPSEPGARSGQPPATPLEPERPSEHARVFGTVPPFESRLPPETRQPVTRLPREERAPSERPPAVEGAPAQPVSVEPSAAPGEGSDADTDPAAGSKPAALYDPRELDEAADLPLERKRQILDLFYRMPKLDYYELLGVAYTAERKEIRAAYFALSKAFHPDSMFRKELGSFKAKMSSVFQALTEAYETLSKKKSREEYDAYLRSTRSIKDAERALANEDVLRVEAHVEVPRPPPLPTAAYEPPAPTPLPAAAPPPERREPSPEARRLAREVLERRLRGIVPRGASTEGTARAADKPPSATSPPAVPAPGSPARQDIARRLMGSLIEASKVTGSGDKLTRALQASRSALDRGDIADAVQHMARAVSLAPERADLELEYQRLSRMLAEKMADDYAEQARFEMKHGKWAAAAVSWAKVCEGRPDDAQAQRSAGYALLKEGGDLRSAQKYAQRATFLAPGDVDARILLAQIYLTVGLKLNARRELDTAAKLDPENEMVKNLLSELKA